jgi:hypothetical protein
MMLSFLGSSFRASGRGAGIDSSMIIRKPSVTHFIEESFT